MPELSISEKLINASNNLALNVKVLRIAEVHGYTYKPLINKKLHRLFKLLAESVERDINQLRAAVISQNKEYLTLEKRYAKQHQLVRELDYILNSIMRPADISEKAKRKIDKLRRKLALETYD